ncbi:hypothetical protein F4703DRAFT_1867146 [Phycomyces blakesleeanus]
MLTNVLPFEILGIISTFISTDDILVCTTVCKAWNAPFKDTLWETVNIKTNERLKAICTVSHTEKNIYQANGNRVQTLSFRKMIRMNDSQLHTIQTYFQRVKNVHMPLGSLTKEDFGLTADWSLWKSLINLEIFMPALTLDNQKEELLNILSFLPCLKRLDLAQEYSYRVQPYTWETLESIHEYLSQLEHLRLHLFLHPIPTKDVLLIKDVIPATHMASAEFLGHNMDHEWLFYFAMKYPNIQTLNAKAIYKNQLEEYTQNDETIDTVPEVSQQFSRIKKVTLRQEAIQGLHYDAFWRLFHELVRSVKSLEYNLQLKDAVSGQQKDTVRDAICFRSETLEKLILRVKSRFSIPSILFTNLGICPRLVDLTMEVSNAAIEFDVLLDNCALLNKVRFRDQRIVLSSDPSKPVVHHGLQSIELYMSSIDADVFKYTSSRCWHLSELRLQTVRVPVSIAPETGVFCIDMSYTHFDVLNLEGVKFDLLDDNDEYDEDDEDDDEYDLLQYEEYNVNLIAIERIHSKSKHASCTDSVVLFENVPPTTVDKRLWFHQYWEATINNEKKEARMLERQETRFAENYFKYFALNSGSTPCTYKSRFPGGLVKKPFWKEDLGRGYLLLRCGYVGNYIINESLFDHDIKLPWYAIFSL